MNPMVIVGVGSPGIDQQPESFIVGPVAFNLSQGLRIESINLGWELIISASRSVYEIRPLHIGDGFRIQGDGIDTFL
jgi:hypothetical protein